MKLFTLAIVTGLLFSVSAVQAGSCDNRSGSYVPTYCETPKAAPVVPKAQAKKAPQNFQYKAPKRAPAPYVRPQKRYEESPLFIVPSFFGMLLAGSVDAVEDGVTGVYRGVKGLAGDVSGSVYSGVDSAMPDR